MKKLSTLMMALSLVAVCSCHAQAVEVLISPDTVVIEQGDTEVTLNVHAETSCTLPPETAVVLEGLLDEGIDADSTGCDDRGELVAKFTVPVTGSWLEDGNVTLTLKVGGVTIDSDTISIIIKTEGGPDPDDKSPNQDGNREGVKDND